MLKGKSCRQYTVKVTCHLFFSISCPLGLGVHVMPDIHVNVRGQCKGTCPLHVCPRDQPQVATIRDKCLRPLRHLISPIPNSFDCFSFSHYLCLSPTSFYACLPKALVSLHGEENHSVQGSHFFAHYVGSQLSNGFRIYVRVNIMGFFQKQ